VKCCSIFNKHLKKAGKVNELSVSVSFFAERAVFMERLVKYKQEKLEMEQQLTGRFLAVLNAKKEYIQQLEDRLQGTVMLVIAE
jgi:hypothetical protein